MGYSEVNLTNGNYPKDGYSFLGLTGRRGEGYPSNINTVTTTTNLYDNWGAAWIGFNVPDKNGSGELVPKYGKHEHKFDSYNLTPTKIDVSGSALDNCARLDQELQGMSEEEQKALQTAYHEGWQSDEKPSEGFKVLA